MRRDGYMWFSYAPVGGRMRWHAAKLNGPSSLCAGPPAPRNRVGEFEPLERDLACPTCWSVLAKRRPDDPC